MQNFICVQCGTQFAETVGPPQRCPICQDERQFVRHTGQEWTTLEQLRANHHNRIEDEAPQLLGIGTEPEFAIGQRALLLQSPGGNLLWDCISLLDDETIAEVNARGGIRAIAISHPHFYSSMIEWAECFDARIFLHSADSKGALLTGDIITVVQDRRYVSFLRSYPNLIPLGASAIRRIVEKIEPFSFEQIYGGWWQANVLSYAKAAVTRSAERYLRWISR